MDLMNSNRFFAGCCLYLDGPVAADWKIKLRDLVVLRIIRIKIILAVKFIAAGDLAVRRQTHGHRVLYHLLIQYRKGSRHTGTYRTGMCIGSSSKRRGTAAEDLSLRRKLHVNL